MANGDTRRAVRDFGPMILFALLTIGGMVFIWTAKLHGYSLPFVTGVPLALMAVYFLMSVVFAGFRLHNEQAGDNCYYMGFLFTLSSLGVSLYQFSIDTSIDTIVRNFGIAVTSTIAGVTLRILFNQMRRDPLDIERSARHELAEMTRRVRTELDSSSREFAHYRRVSNQMLTEGFEEIARQAERNGEEIRKAVEALSNDAIKPIKEAAEKLTAVLDVHQKAVNDRADEAVAKLGQATSELAGIIDRFGTSVEGVSGKIDQLAAPTDVLASSLAPTLAALKDLTAKHLERLDHGAEQGEKQSAQTEASLASLTRIEEVLRGMSRLASSVERATGVNRPAAPIQAASRLERNSDVELVRERPIREATHDARPLIDDDLTVGEPETPRKRWFGW